MAIIATLLGGIIGFISFIIAMLFFDASFLSACGVYMIAAFTTTASAIALAMVPTREEDTDTEAALSA